MNLVRWWLLLSGWPLAVWADDDVLSQVMRALATVPAVEAAFREEKTLALLQEPLITQGVLYYRAPAYLRKRTLKPQPEEFQADGDWLTIEMAEQGRRDFNLKGYPQLQPFVEAIRATQAGDQATLERYYQLEFQGTLENWVLHLTPRDRQAAGFIKAIIIRGQRAWIASVETLEPDGDRSLMTVTPR
jgi:outer membrane lipoprotein-sorting protein